MSGESGTLQAAVGDERTDYCAALLACGIQDKDIVQGHSMEIDCFYSMNIDCFTRLDKQDEKED